MVRDARQTLLLLALAAVAAGCRFDADYDGSRLRCSPASPRCPDGYTCVADVCTGDGLDAATGDGATTDATVCELAAAAQDNDGCGAALDLTAAALAAGGTVAYGDTTGYVNDLTPSTLPMCTGSPEPGPDALYRLTLVAGDQVTLTLSPDGWTGAVYLVDGCTSTAACKGGAASFSVATIAIATAGTYYIVVDSAATADAGCYALAATIIR